MKKDKRVLIILIIVALMINIVSCGKQVDDNELSIIENLIYNDETTIHEKRLLEYETPYTICYKNQDGSVSLYLFPSPISYEDEEGKQALIDTSLKKVEEKSFIDMGYVLQTASGDVISYYPEKMCLGPIVIKNTTSELSFNVEDKYRGDKYAKYSYIDLLGINHDSISYLNDDIYGFEYIPTSTGTTVNILLKEKPIDNNLSFYIDDQPGVTLSMKNKVVTIVNDSNEGVIGAITHSYMSDSKGNISFNSNVLLEKINNRSKYTIVIDDEFINNVSLQYPITFSVSFDFIPNMLSNVTDYTIQSNDILSGYSVIGNSDCFGKGSLYLKYRIGYFVKSYEQNIRNATYNFVCLEGNSVSTIEFGRIRDFWDIYSQNEELPEAYISEGSVDIDKKGRYSIDITKFIKDCIYDDTLNTEDYGLVITNDSDEIIILSNYNNSMYKPYVRIDFYDLPWTFENINQINPST